MWRTHWCVPCSHSCEHKLDTEKSQRPHEWGRGTHACATSDERSYCNLGRFRSFRTNSSKIASTCLRYW
jgi:hypothetical protein